MLQALPVLLAPLVLQAQQGLRVQQVLMVPMDMMEQQGLKVHKELPALLVLLVLPVQMVQTVRMELMAKVFQPVGQQARF